MIRDEQFYQTFRFSLSRYSALLKTTIFQKSDEKFHPKIISPLNPRSMILRGCKIMRRHRNNGKISWLPFGNVLSTTPAQALAVLRLISTYFSHFPRDRLFPPPPLPFLPRERKVSHVSVWVHVLERISTPPARVSPITVFHELPPRPTTLLLLFHTSRPRSPTVSLPILFLSSCPLRTLLRESLVSEPSSLSFSLSRSHPRLTTTY